MATQKEILLAKGLAWVKAASNKEIQALCSCNPGRASNVRREALEELGAEVLPRNARSSSTPTPTHTPRAKKARGFLPGRIQGWMEAREGLMAGDLSPDDFEAVIAGDSPAWNLLLARIAPPELEAFEAWLGQPASFSRQAEEIRKAEAAAVAAEVQREYAALYASALADLADLHGAVSVMKQNGFRIFQDDYGLMRVTQNWPMPA